MTSDDFKPTQRKFQQRRKPPRLPEFKLQAGISPRAQKKAILTKRSKKVKVTLPKFPPGGGNYPAEEEGACTPADPET